MNSRALSCLAILAALLAVAGPGRAQSDVTVAGVKLGEFPAAGAAPIVRVVNAGANPKRELRYHFAAGSSHRMVMTMRMSIGMEMDGRPAPVGKMPAMRMLFDNRVTEADERGARVEFTMPGQPELFETEDVQPAMLEAMRKGLAHLASVRGHVAMTNRGIVRDARFEAGPGLDQGAAQMLQSMQQSMEQMSVPLPLEAVGEGAQWKVLQRVHAQGMTVYQVSTFSLTRLDGPAATMAISIEQYGPRQDMAVPEKAKGARIQLVAMQGRGQGQLQMDLRSPVPRSSASAETTVVMSVEAEGRTLQMRMNNRMQVQVEPGR